jgi:hypothetical protein
MKTTDFFIVCRIICGKDTEFFGIIRNFPEKTFAVSHFFSIFANKTQTFYNYKTTNYEKNAETYGVGIMLLFGGLGTGANGLHSYGHAGRDGVHLHRDAVGG